MKKDDVSARKVACQIVLALGCLVFIQLVGARDARAESPSVEAESPRKVEGFEALGTLGYGVYLGDEDEGDPLGVMVGADFGWTLPVGLRIGTDARYGFGRKGELTNWRGEVIPRDPSSIMWGVSVGYDLLFSSGFRLRGAADSGFIFRIEEGDVSPPWFYVGPKVALIWQYRSFELGLQSAYWFPRGVQAGLMGGARF